MVWATDCIVGTSKRYHVTITESILHTSVTTNGVFNDKSATISHRDALSVRQRDLNDINSRATAAFVGNMVTVTSMSSKERYTSNEPPFASPTLTRH
ncbi:unnamed protein product [Danaus chrysippus]|uniref:(African queen) hypothetical protein n=1 Tax=Danaus chrysippus TaxID=151541 RepID=A0A8J2R208_9NEOP|nr:unnamed protein product [Danaus chrysippus]